MKRLLAPALTLILLAAALGVGYWWGATSSPPRTNVAAVPTADAPAQPDAGRKKLLYYRNPMGLPDVSPVPKKDPMGMDYVPV